MFLGRANLKDDEDLLIIGLSAKNREQLIDGYPVDISRASHGVTVPEKLHICLFFGETEEDMLEQLRPLIGPGTIVGQKDPQ